MGRLSSARDCRRSSTSDRARASDLTRAAIALALALALVAHATEMRLVGDDTVRLRPRTSRTSTQEKTIDSLRKKRARPHSNHRDNADRHVRARRPAIDFYQSLAGEKDLVAATLITSRYGTGGACHNIDKNATTDVLPTSNVFTCHVVAAAALKCRKDDWREKRGNIFLTALRRTARGG